MAHPALPIFLAASALAATAVPLQNQQSGGYGYGSGNVGASRVGAGASDAMGGMPTDTPPGVGYNVQGGEMSRASSQKAALASDYHVHFSGATASDAAGASSSNVSPAAKSTEPRGWPGRGPAGARATATAALAPG